ncbi:hypothetical protein AAFF_G00233680 [Aldrovandia affinis]|uniref:Clusterin C-terminal domain-containing protein n=1 Tax=Aldrovandia affinis TaxID=143900 RepID=A0AAD7RF23_9TELE|nr:hypothetical protein AAFF_G00233680 [Aldrovandia affinis]
MTSRGSQDVLVNSSPDDPDLDVLKVEDSFNRLLHKVGTLYDKSVMLVSNMHKEFDQVFQTVFSPETRGDEAAPHSPAHREMDSDFFRGIGLDEVVESLFDFGKSVLQEFSSVITQVFDDIHKTVQESDQQKEKETFPRWVPLQSRKLCRDLHRQTSECWQLSSRCEFCQGALLEECPSVRDLQVELNEVSELVQVSSQQYEEVLQIAQRHTEDTVSWLTNMATDFGWVAELPINSTAEAENIFSISAVVPHPVERYDSSTVDSTVEVNILNSPGLTLSVPAELQVQDPAFIQYVAQEALGRYKQLLR